MNQLTMRPAVAAPPEDPDLLSKTRRSLERYGLLETARLAPRPVIRRLFRQFLTPSLGAIDATLQQTFVDPRAFAAASLGVPGVPPELWDEAENVGRELGSAVRDSTAPLLTHPADWGASTPLAMTLYVAARVARPSLVLETGVANGISTFFLLAALNRNGAGRLVSTDVTDRAGRLVSSSDVRRWTFRALAHPFDRSFRALAESLGPVDFYFHDAAHDYRWQTFEFETMFRSVRPGGVFLSDDVDSSFAFLDFVTRHRLAAVALVGTRQVAGALRPRPAVVPYPADGDQPRRA